MLASGRLKEIRYIVEADMEVDRACVDDKEGGDDLSFRPPGLGVHALARLVPTLLGRRSQEPPE